MKIKGNKPKGKKFIKTLKRKKKCTKFKGMARWDSNLLPPIDLFTDTAAILN